MKLIYAERIVMHFFGCDKAQISKCSEDEIIEMANMVRSATTFSQEINAREDRFVVEVGFDEGFYANVWDKHSPIGGSMAGFLEALGQKTEGRANLIAWPFELSTIEDLRSAIERWADIPREVAEKLEAARINSDWTPIPEWIRRIEHPGFSPDSIEDSPAQDHANEKIPF
jgi:hypothetical protein